MRKTIIRTIFISIIIFIIIFFIIYLFTMRINMLSIGNTMESIDRINWYLSNDGDYYLFLSKNIDRNHLYIKIDTNYDGAIYKCYDINGNKIGNIKNNSYTDIFNYDELVISVSLKNRITSRYKVHVIQSDIPSLFIKIKGGDSNYNRILSSKYHTIGYKADALLYDDDNNMDSLKIKKIKIYLIIYHYY